MRHISILLFAIITTTSAAWSFNDPYVLDMDVKISDHNLKLDEHGQNTLVLNLPELSDHFIVNPDRDVFTANIPAFFPDAYPQIIAAASELDGHLAVHVEGQTRLVYEGDEAYLEEVVHVTIGEFVIEFERVERTGPIEQDDNDEQANLFLQQPNLSAGNSLIGAQIFM